MKVVFFTIRIIWILTIGFRFERDWDDHDSDASRRASKGLIISLGAIAVSVWLWTMAASTLSMYFEARDGEPSDPWRYAGAYVTGTEALMGLAYILLMVYFFWRMGLSSITLPFTTTVPQRWKQAQPEMLARIADGGNVLKIGFDSDGNRRSNVKVLDDIKCAIWATNGVGIQWATYYPASGDLEISGPAVRWRSAGRTKGAMGV